MSPAHVIHLIEHSQVVYRIEHSAPVQAIVGTLLTTLVGLAVAAFFNRRRIAWRAYVDAPITLDAGLAKTMGSRVIHKVYVADGDSGQPTQNAPGWGRSSRPRSSSCSWSACCSAAHITVAADNSGSVNGLNTLNGAAAQIKAIYDGAYTNWRQLGGPDLPIRIISRDFGSGSRRAFDAYVLGGASEPSPTSFDCRTTSDPSARVILCDAQSTADLLGDVENIPGAIGYAQTGDVTTAPPGTLQSVALNGLSGSFGNIGRAKNNYQYLTTEYIYTNGRASGLAAAFIGYLSNAVALNDLADAGYTPCHDPDHPSAARLCALPGS